METINKEINIFTFDELSDSAKDTVRYSGIVGDHWNSEGWESLKKWSELLGFTYRDVNIEHFYVERLEATTINQYCHCDYDNELTGDRLRKWIINNHGSSLVKGKFYATPGKYVDGKYTYKKRHSNIIMDVNCPTGYCLDYDFIEPLLQFLNEWGTGKYTTYEDVIMDCIRSWAKSLYADIQSQYEDEYISDYCEANEYRFLEDGTFYRG